jgi:AAA15 family ATPase/GTPase
MIKSINIQNFKIFKKSKFADFGQVNLLGGLNNGGKTTLLEAIYLGVSPSNSSILNLKRLRREEIDKHTVSETFETIWDNLFYLHNRDLSVTIDITTEQDDFYRLNMTCDSKIDDFIEYIKNDDDNDTDLSNISKSLSNQENSKCALHIESKKNTEDYTSSVLVSSKNGLLGRGLNATSIKKVAFIPSIGRMEGEGLAKIYSQTELRNKHLPVIELLKVFDKDIEHVRVFNNTGKPLLNIQRKTEPFMLLSSFGDAMNRMVDLVLKIVNNENGIILIDEIENGVHYQKHDDIWTLIFTLAKRFKVQIFATTHSKEMMSSFDNIATKYNTIKSRYIEVFKSARTNDIKSNVFDAEKLKYALSKNEPLRGEN